MLVVHRRWWQVAAVLGLLGFTPTAAFAAGWADDFNDFSITDNNPVTWVTDLDFGGGPSGLFTGTYSAASGDFFMDPDEGSLSGGQMSALVPMALTDTYIRTQGIVIPDPNDPNNTGGNLVVTARIDPANLTGYLMYFDVSGNLNIQILLGAGAFDDLGDSVDIPFNAGTEVVIELDVIGDQLNGYVWAADDPAGKPELPQITYTDATYTTAGLAGLGFAEDDDGTSVFYRYAAAQETPFIDSDPSNGDYDGDGDVDGADFLTWQRGLGLTGQPDATTGDSDDDGDVDAADLALWQSHFGGAPAVAAVGAIPEPASLALLAAGAMAICGIRWRRGRS
jgi:hypothetical protein